jgi:hypothetical protein
MVTCMTCLRDVAVGHWIKPGVYEFKDLRLWEVCASNCRHLIVVLLIGTRFYRNIFYQALISRRIPLLSRFVIHSRSRACRFWSDRPVAHVAFHRSFLWTGLTTIGVSHQSHARSGFSLRQSEAGGAPHKPTPGGSRSTLASHLSRTGSNARAPSLADIEHPDSSDVEALSSDAEHSSPLKAHSVIDVSSSEDDRGKGKSTKRTQEWTFPDGEVIVIESSDDDGDIGNATLSQKSIMGTPRPSGSRGALATPRPPGAFGTPRAGPLTKTASNMSWTYRSPSQALSQSSSRNASSASEAGPSRLKRRYQFEDQVVYLTDEETDGGSSSKRRRYDTENEIETDATTDVDGDEEMSDDNRAMMPGTFGKWTGVLILIGLLSGCATARGRSDTIMPGYLEAYGQGSSDEDEGLLEGLGSLARNSFDTLGNVIQNYCGPNLAYPDMGYHAPAAIGGLPIPATRPVQRVGSEFHFYCGLTYAD